MEPSGSGDREGVYSPYTRDRLPPNAVLECRDGVECRDGSDLHSAADRDLPDSRNSLFLNMFPPRSIRLRTADRRPDPRQFLTLDSSDNSSDSSLTLDSSRSFPARIGNRIRGTKIAGWQHPNGLHILTTSYVEQDAGRRLGQ